MMKATHNMKNYYPFFCNRKHSCSLSHDTNILTDTPCHMLDSGMHYCRWAQNVQVYTLVKGKLKLVTFQIIKIFHQNSPRINTNIQLMYMRQVVCTSLELKIDLLPFNLSLLMNIRNISKIVQCISCFPFHWVFINPLNNN